MGRVGQIQTLKTNVRRDGDVRLALRGADAAINLVGILAQGGGQRFNALHVEAAERIARLSAEMQVGRLIHFSAIGASEEAPAIYFQTKAEGERRVQAAQPAATIVRPALVFGPEDQFFNRFASLARFLPALPLIGGGHTRFKPVFVADVAQGVTELFRHHGTRGAIYEFAGPEEMTLKEVMQFTLREIARKRLLLPVPYGIATLQGAILQFLPGKLLTMDQVRMLRTDTVPSGAQPGLRELGIVPVGPQAIAPTYLWRFRKQGQFTTVTP
jgi:NADH dehydrogenase